MTFALVGYFLKLAFVCVLSYGLFVNPRGLKWMLLKIFKLRWLHVGTGLSSGSGPISCFHRMKSNAPDGNSG